MSEYGSRREGASDARTRERASYGWTDVSSYAYAWHV